MNTAKPCSGRAMGTFLAVALIIASPVLSSAQDEAETAQELRGFEPLEIIIRPREQVSESGIYHDAVVESIYGRFYRFSGLYIDTLRASPGSVLPDIDYAQRALSPPPIPMQTPEQRMTARFMYGDRIGMVMGAEYRDMSFMEIARMYGVDPTPAPIGMPSNRGIYARTTFNELYDPGNQIFGVISFDGLRAARGNQE